MDIGEIKTGTKMAFFVEVDMRATGSAYEAEFKHVEWDKLFVVSNPLLFSNFDSLVNDTQFIIAFEIGPMIYTFAGRLREKKRAANMVVVEQTGYIKEYNRRKRSRDELLIPLDIFDLPPENYSSGEFGPLTDIPIFSELSYDISTGGLCVITNSILKSEFEPFFLIRLAITDKDVFVLPAKLVRNVKLRRTGLGNFEYGFQFLYDNLPGMEKKLTEAIMRKKLG